MEELIGKYIGRYHILSKLGEGGMAVVYKAFDTRLERDVAVKFIRTDRIAPQDLTQMLLRFEREAKALARFHHPNIVTIFDYGEFEGSPYLIMEYLPGDNLKNLLGKTVDWQKALKLLIPIANALEYAHNRDILHRDVKPGNILFDENEAPKLADFGIAMVLESEDSDRLTQTGTGVGTPDYMSPEQCLGMGATIRSDVYSFGIVLYELVTGRRPYRADTPMAVIIKQINDPLPQPRQLNPELPQALEDLLFKALAKDPNERYQSMQQIANAMQAILDNSVSNKPSPNVADVDESSRVESTANHEDKPPEEVTRIDSFTRVPFAQDASKNNADGENIADMATRVDFSPARTPLKTPLVHQKAKPSLGIWIGVALLILALSAWGIMSLLPKPGSAPAAIPIATQTLQKSTVVATSIPTTIPPTSMPAAPAALKICQITDIGGINDQSFNASAWQGIEMAANELKISGEYRESQSAQDYEQNINAFIEEKCDLIIAMGFLFGDATLKAAQSHPEINFSIVDYSYQPPQPNIVAQTYKSDEASFLAGYLAASMSKSGKVATFGGMDIPSVTMFMDGFAQGVQYFNQQKGKQIAVIGRNAKSPGEDLFTNNFDDQMLAKEITTSLLNQGADIIFPVAGQAGLGAAMAIQEHGTGLLIGVDSDWAVVNPQYENIILTSVIKHIERTTFIVIQGLQEGHFQGGDILGNLENGGVDLAPFHVFEDQVSDELRQELLSIREQIIAGAISIQ